MYNKPRIVELLSLPYLGEPEDQKLADILIITNFNLSFSFCKTILW